MKQTTTPQIYFSQLLTVTIQFNLMFL